MDEIYHGCWLFWNAMIIMKNYTCVWVDIHGVADTFDGYYRWMVLRIDGIDVSIDFIGDVSMDDIDGCIDVSSVDE